MTSGKWLHGPSARLLAMQAIDVDTGDHPRYSFEGTLTIHNSYKKKKKKTVSSRSSPGPVQEQGVHEKKSTLVHSFNNHVQ